MKKEKGFTLVELLVVISIIAMLLSIMMPGLQKARMVARSVVCASNLKQWNMVCYGFANDFKGSFPTSYKYGVSDLKNFFPIFINDVSGSNTNGLYDDEAGGQWKAYGAPWNTLLRYGMTEKLAFCPSDNWLKHFSQMFTLTSEKKSYLWFAPDGYWGGIWRRWVPQSYMFVTGLDATAAPVADINFRDKKPLTKNGKNASSAVMVADTVMYIPTGTSWSANVVGRKFFINHPAQEGKVSSQNIAYGDGHVERQGSSYYNGSLQSVNTRSKTGCWSYQSGAGGPWFFWEGGVTPRSPF